MLIDRNGAITSGPAADDGYARMVVARALNNPGALLSFTGRVRLPDNRLPDRQDLRFIEL